MQTIFSHILQRIIDEVLCHEKKNNTILKNKVMSNVVIVLKLNTFFKRHIIQMTNDRPVYIFTIGQLQCILAYRWSFGLYDVIFY